MRTFVEAMMLASDLEQVPEQERHGGTASRIWGQGVQGHSREGERINHTIKILQEAEEILTREVRQLQMERQRVTLEL